MSENWQPQGALANDATAPSFAGRLMQARRMRGLSQVALARKAGLPPSSISHFEAESRRPSLDNLRRLATALCVTTDYLLCQDETVDTSTRIHAGLGKLSDSQLEVVEQLLKVLAASNENDRLSAVWTG